MGDICGIGAYKRYMATSADDALTGMHLEEQDIIARDDKVVVRSTDSGTQTGPFMGAPATGKHAQWLGIGIYNVIGGKIAEAWFGEDILGMLLQLNAISLPHDSPWKADMSAGSAATGEVPDNGGPA